MSTKEQLRAVLEQNTLPAVLGTLCEMLVKQQEPGNIIIQNREETLRHLRNAHLASLDSDIDADGDIASRID